MLSTYLLQYSFSFLVYACLAYILTKLVLAHKKSSTPTRAKRLVILLTLYITAVLTVTVLPRLEFYLFAPDNSLHIEVHSPSSYQTRHFNLVPFRTILSVASGKAFAGMDAVNKVQVEHLNIAGNIALFIPIGILSAFLFKGRHRNEQLILFPLLLSCCIELVQYFELRGADIDDIILNTLGGLIGSALCLLIRHLYHNFTQKSEKGGASV
jgi:glycopeptide antibiotics resistance protein